MIPKFVAMFPRPVSMKPFIGFAFWTFHEFWIVLFGISDDAVLLPTATVYLLMGLSKVTEMKRL